MQTFPETQVGEARPDQRTNICQYRYQELGDFDFLQFLV
jgi:hypothetical protein